MYKITLSKQAEKDLVSLHKSEANVYKKALTLIKEVSEHPFTGKGKPEPLKYDLSGKWSRRINREH